MPTPTATMPKIATPTGPSLILFGSADSGKSSLLGALVQAAESQGGELKGKLQDDTGGLASLQKAAYADKMPDTTQELTAYPVHFTPTLAPSRPWQAVLYDCSGVAADLYLEGKRPLGDPHPLSQTLLVADTVLLVVAAGLDGDELEKPFQEFTKFLHLLEEARGKQADLAGLPVYLVLTKCDKLAEANDTTSVWIQKIEEAKRRIGEKFRDFISAWPHGPRFGTVRMRVWATAVKRPALGDRPAKSLEPYGVAELFRQALESAATFHQRRHRADGRMNLTAAGMSALITFLLLLSGVLMLMQPNEELVKLEDQVRTALPSLAPTSIDLLRGSQDSLDSRLKLLTAIKEHPGFHDLALNLRDAVDRQQEEIASYSKSLRDSQNEIKLPHLAKNEEELKQFEKQATSFVLPKKYADAWSDTRLGKRLRQTKSEYASLHAAATAEEAWIRANIEECRQLTLAGNKLFEKLVTGAKVNADETDQWFDAIRRHLQLTSRKPPEEPIPGVSRLMNEDLRRFQRVQAALEDWRSAKLQLGRVYDNVNLNLKKLSG
jgi:GTP-binding protein EngB required for normal cell division